MCYTVISSHERPSDLPGNFGCSGGEFADIIDHFVSVDISQKHFSEVLNCLKGCQFQYSVTQTHRKTSSNLQYNINNDRS